jgi:hypothetical protein
MLAIALRDRSRRFRLRAMDDSISGKCTIFIALAGVRMLLVRSPMWFWTLGVAMGVFEGSA